jgi:hypothetical protein
MNMHIRPVVLASPDAKSSSLLNRVAGQARELNATSVAVASPGTIYTWGADNSQFDLVTGSGLLSSFHIPVWSMFGQSKNARNPLKVIVDALLALPICFVDDGFPRKVIRARCADPKGGSGAIASLESACQCLCGPDVFNVGAV